jgi:hypothetical protein
VFDVIASVSLPSELLERPRQAYTRRLLEDVPRYWAATAAGAGGAR